MQEESIQPVIASNASLISVGDLFKKSFGIYKTNFWLFIKLSAINCLVLLAAVPLWVFMFIGATQHSMQWYLIAALIFLICALIGITIDFWVKTSLLIAVKEQNPQGKVRDYLSKGKAIIGSYGWICILTGLAILGGFLLFIIPGIIFAVWFSLSAYVFIAENKKGTAALKQSKALVKGYWWPVFGRIALLMVIGIAIGSLSTLGTIGNLLFTMPFGMAYMFIIYQDLKRIKGI